MLSLEKWPHGVAGVAGVAGVGLLGAASLEIPLDVFCSSSEEL